jgi:hypothetical protein
LTPDEALNLKALLEPFDNKINLLRSEIKEIRDRVDYNAWKTDFHRSLGEIQLLIEKISKKLGNDGA